MKTIRKILAILLCGFGLIMPWKMRCVYIEILGWITQFIYLSYIVILKFILKELEKAKQEQVVYETK
ncbi:MAG: hypothetical protein AB7S78_08685 [Candidatus Omnitrophota bacterium]